MAALVLCSGGLERPLAPVAAPEWVHLLPGGRMTGRDGKSYTLSDPHAVIRAFQAGAIDLPIDYEHQNDRPEARLSGPVPAAGWIKEMAARATGLWARVEWTDRARQMIANREYRYLSPTIICNRNTLEVLKVKGAGLVHNPNLHLTALASQETDMAPETTLLQEIIAALGLAPDTPPEDVLSLVLRLKDAEAAPAANRETLAQPDPAKFVPIATVQTILAERNEKIAVMSEGRAREKVSEATRKGYLSPAMQDWAISLCRNDEASFDDFITRSVPPFAHLFATHARGPAPGRGVAMTASPEVEALCAQLGIEPTAFTD